MIIDPGFLPQAHGSSRVSLGKGMAGGWDSTDIIATIKAEVNLLVFCLPGEFVSLQVTSRLRAVFVGHGAIS